MFRINVRFLGDMSEGEFQKFEKNIHSFVSDRKCSDYVSFKYVLKRSLDGNVQLLADNMLMEHAGQLVFEIEKFLKNEKSLAIFHVKYDNPSENIWDYAICSISRDGTKYVGLDKIFEVFKKQQV